MSDVRGIRIDATEFGELFVALEKVDKKLALEIKRELRAEAAPLVKKMRDAVTDPTSKRSAKIVQTRKRQKSGAEYEVRTNTAALVAKGIGFRMGNGKTPYVRFSSTAANLPEERKAMAKALNLKKFRHPVFLRQGKGPTKVLTKRSKGIRGALGKREAVWIDQPGRPYFGAVAVEEREQLIAAIERALDRVASSIGRSRIRN